MPPEFESEMRPEIRPEFQPEFEPEFEPEFQSRQFDLMTTSTAVATVAPAFRSTHGPMFAPMTAHESFSPNIAVSVFKMRCPACRKLYSVQASVVEEAKSPLKFQCQSCQSKFEALTSRNGALLETQLVSDPMSDPMSEQTSATAAEIGLNLNFTPDATSGVTPDVAPDVTSHLNTEVSCPKCRGRNSARVTECRHCGVVFSKFERVTQLEKNQDRGVQAELLELWAALIEAYDDPEHHDRFISECYKQQCLPYAAQKYARILSVSPTEPIANSMCRRIAGLASFKSQTATGPDGGSSVQPGFRIPKLNDLILILGGMVMTTGMMLPNCKDLTGLGIAAVVLGVGIRFFLGPKIL